MKRSEATDNEPAAGKKAARVDAFVDDETQKEYLAQQPAALLKLEAYAERVDACREKLVITPHPTRADAYVFVLSDDASMTPAELEACKRVSVPDQKGKFAEALHRRTPAALKLPVSAKELHLVTREGRKVAVLLRSVLGAELAARGHPALNSIHDEHSVGWFQGCEVTHTSPTPAPHQPLHPEPSTGMHSPCTSPPARGLQ